jgi:hypothetical protein
MNHLRRDLIKLAYDNPGKIRDALLPILKGASVQKTANWWGTILLRDEGNTYALFVGGENHAAGWSSWTYMSGELNGRLKKLSDDVVKVLRANGFDIRGGNETFGNSKGFNYIGRKFYGKKPVDVDLETLLREQGPKASLKTDMPGF